MKRLPVGTSRDVLDLDGLIDRPWSKLVPVGRDGDWPDRTAMALERLCAGTGRDVPDPDGLIA